MTDGLSTGVPSSVVVMQAGTSTAVAQTTTDSSGAYSTTVSDGSYDVVVTPNSSSFVPRTVFEVSVSSPRVLDVALVRVGTGQLTGRLVDRLGQPVSQVVMSLVGSGVPTVSYTTSTDGTFAFTVPNGQYQLQLTTNNCSSPSGDVPGTATAGCYWDLATAAQALQVSGNRNFGDLALPSPTHVTVTVVDPAGAPVPGAAFNIGNVSCVRCGAYFPIAQGMTIGGMPITTGSTTLWNYTPPSTDASGRATILVWPSTTTGSFTVTPPPASGYGAVALNNTPLTTDQSITIRLETASQLTGRLVDRLGQPVSQVVMSLVGSG
ncbi:MAG: hypothetical protein WCP59_11945, partial [Actinomycetota bacterium]